VKDFENRLIFGVEVMGKSRLAGGVHSLLQIKPTVHFTCVYVFLPVLESLVSCESSFAGDSVVSVC